MRTLILAILLVTTHAAHAEEPLPPEPGHFGVGYAMGVTSEDLAFALALDVGIGIPFVPVYLHTRALVGAGVFHSLLQGRAGLEAIACNKTRRRCLLVGLDLAEQRIQDIGFDRTLQASHTTPAFVPRIGVAIDGHAHVVLDVTIADDRRDSALLAFDYNFTM